MVELSRKITFNTLAQIVCRAGVIVVSLITTAILTRRLGQEKYGAFGVINTAVVTFFSLADWGTNLIAVRESSKSPQKQGLIFFNCLILRSMMAIIGIGFYLIFIFLNPYFSKFRNEAMLSSLIILFFSLRTTAQIVFHSKLQLYWSQLIELLSSLVFAILLFSMQKSISLFQTIKFLNFSAFVSALAAIFLAVCLLRVSWRVDFSLLKRILVESLPMGALMVTFAVYNRVDTFLLQAIKGGAATGIYVLAYKIHDNLVLGAAYLMNSFFPVISGMSLACGKKKKLLIALQKALDFLLIMALPIVLIFFLFAPPLINLLGGEDFLLSAKVLRILIFATGIAYFNHLSGYSLAALGWQRSHLRFGIIALIFNIGLNFLLIPGYSFYGAALATVLTEGLIFVLTFRFLKKKTGIRFNLKSSPKTFLQIIRKEELFK